MIHPVARRVVSSTSRIRIPPITRSVWVGETYRSRKSSESAKLVQLPPVIMYQMTTITSPAAAMSHGATRLRQLFTAGNSKKTRDSA